MLHNNLPKSFATGSRDGLMSKEDKVTLQETSNEIKEVKNIVDTSYEVAKSAKEFADLALKTSQGKSSGHVFNTKEELDAWLADEENTAYLQPGTSLYIKDLETPDYWWDGETIQILETQKVDLVDYIKKTDSINNNTVDFNTDEELQELTSGSNLKTLFGTVSKSIKSLINLITKVGDTDISENGNSITEAINNICNNFLKKTGGDVTGDITMKRFLNFKDDYTGGMVRGIQFINSSDDSIFGRIGGYGSAGDWSAMYIGFGEGAHSKANSLYLTPTNISWLGNDLLDTSNFSDYALALTGGTLSERLTINSTYANVLILRRSGTSGNTQILFGNASADYGTLAMKNVNSPLYRVDTNSNWFKILDEATAGDIQLPAVGRDCYIQYPEGGMYRNSSGDITGYLTITLPQSWTNTMMKFKLSIYNYGDNTSCDYYIAGYNYADGASWLKTSVYSISNHGGMTSITNLPVRFGHNGTKCVIQIGNNNTVWTYPQITVTEVQLGYMNTEYDKWASGWNISFTTTLVTTTVTVSNPANWYRSYLAVCDNDGNAITSTYVKKRTETGTYNNLARYYPGSTTPTYYRIKLPSAIATTNTMIYVELSVRQLYGSKNAGKILINGYKTSGNNVWLLVANTLGNLTSAIKVYSSDGIYLYVAGCGAYSQISIDKILVGDGGRNTDFSNVTIDYVSSLPSTYQTATMYYSPLSSTLYTLGAACAKGVDTTITNGSGNLITSGAVYTEINTLKNSVSDGKKLVANAITDMGVTTATDATFTTMANNIKAIEGNGFNMPLAITTLTASGYTTSPTVTLSWSLPSDPNRCGIRLMYSTSSAPTTPESGTLLYDSATYSGTTITSYNLNTTLANTKYYVTIFSYTYVNNSRYYTKGASINFTSVAQLFYKFTSSGTFTVPSGVSKIRVWIVGAGYNGQAGSHTSSGYTTYFYGGNGGNGGNYLDQTINVSGGQSFTVTIGASNGAASSFGSYNSNSSTGFVAGATGGNGARCATGINAANGPNATAGNNGFYAFNDSSWSTTYDSGIMYCAGGGGGSSYYHYSNLKYSGSSAAGGTTGGGAGGNNYHGSAGRANTGAGGGGASKYYDYDSNNTLHDFAYTGGTGGSGCVIVRVIS